MGIRSTRLHAITSGKPETADHYNCETLIEIPSVLQKGGLQFKVSFTSS